MQIIITVKSRRARIPIKDENIEKKRAQSHPREKFKTVPLQDSLTVSHKSSRGCVCYCGL